MRTPAITFTLLASASVASASPTIELGGALGGHAFSESGELGVDDLMNEPGPASSGLVGLRAGVVLNRRLAVEGEAVVIPTQDDVLGDGATVFGLRTHARFDLLTGKLRPFVVAGLGMHVLRSSSVQMDNDTDRSFHWGGGVRFAVSKKLDVRVDARHLIVPDRRLDGATSDVELTAGVSYKLGGAKPRPIPRRLEAPPPPAPKPGDKDGDGLRDDVDQCPTKPEDKDAFQDDDGCPDLDNDNDGIVDLADKCPLEAETRNSWQDEDGCPDTVIAELTGIGFETNSAKIDGASSDILERALVILRDNPQLSVEISGHTSAEGFVRDNLELSLRRANSVKAYLVAKGIAPKRILTVGHGPDVPVADNATEDGRKKNRRIEFRILRAEEVPQ